MSTFDKACPECEATNSAAAVHCSCGHIFNPLYLEDPHLALEQAAREEQLIEEYLAARAEQAIEGAKKAVQTVLEEPVSESKLLAATRAQCAARAAMADLVEQRVRAVEARLRVHIAEVDQAGEYTGAQSVGHGQKSWQSIVVGEAVNAESVRQAGVRLQRKASVASRRKPGAALKAAQAVKAEKVVGAARRNPDLLSLTASADEGDFVEEVEISGFRRRR